MPWKSPWRVGLKKSMLEFNPDLPATSIDSDHDAHQSAHSSSITVASTPPKCQPEESKSPVEVELMDTADKASTGCLSGVGIDEKIESKDPSMKDEGPETYIHMIRIMKK